MYLSNRWGKFQSWLVQRGLILAGGAAGIAAAFNTPIAGAVFALEEIGRSFEKENAGTIVRTVLVACIVCMGLFGDYLEREGHGKYVEWELKGEKGERCMVACERDGPRPARARASTCARRRTRPRARRSRRRRATRPRPKVKYSLSAPN